MANPVMSRAPDSTGLNLVSVLQSAPPTTGSNGSFSGALEQSVREQERARNASNMRQEPPKRPETSGQQRSAERVTERSRTESAEAGRRERSAPPTRQSEASSEAAARQEQAPPASQTSTTEPGTATDEEPAITAAPANLAVLATIIAALEKGGPGQRLQATDMDGATMDGALRKSLGNALSDLLGRQSAGAGSGDSDVFDQGPASQAAKQLKGDILATSGNIAKNFAQIAQAIATQGSAIQPGAYGSTPATALNPMDASLSSATSQHGIIPGLRSEAASSIPQLQVHTPAGQRAWAEDVGNRMIWMVGRGESRAELVLTPPSLGKLGVSIQVSGEQTTAHFVASTQAARDALEQAMPRLRELLQQAGINLGQADVSTSSERQGNGDENSSARPGFGFGRDREQVVETEPPGLTKGGHWTRTGLGMIDTFA